MNDEVASDLIRRNILDINYLTIYEPDQIIRYVMDYAGNLVPITYKRVVKKRRHYYGRKQKAKKLKIGEEILVDLEFCNI